MVMAGLSRAGGVPHAGKMSTRRTTWPLTTMGGFNMNRLDGKVALITGSAQSIGAAIGEYFVGEGARVAFSDIQHGKGRELAARFGDQAIYVELDVTSEEAWARAIEVTEQRWGRLDILINNASQRDGTGYRDATLTDYLRAVAVTQTGVFLGIKAAIEPMLRAGRGSIINMGSVDSIMPPAANPGYIAGKWAIRGLTKGAAGELATSGIRVNSLLFPIYRTAAILTDNPDQEWVARYAADRPIRRYPEVEEIAQAALYLASDESSYCTASDFVLDGGKTALLHTPERI